MMTNFGYAAIVLALLAGTSSASAQSFRDYDARAVVTHPVPLTQAQRTTIYRTIIPQGRGRQPIVRERIVTEPVAPVARERVVTQPMDSDYYAYGYVPADGPRAIETLTWQYSLSDRRRCGHELDGRRR